MDIFPSDCHCITSPSSHLTTQNISNIFTKTHRRKSKACPSRKGYCIGGILQEPRYHPPSLGNGAGAGAGAGAGMVILTSMI